MPEVRIKTDFGEVVIPYNNIDELREGMKNIEEVVELVNSRVNGIVQKEIRKPKPGYEDLYSFTADGLVEILKTPDSELKTVIMVLFAYHPKGATIQQISESSGVRQVARKYLSAGSYKKYFVKMSKDNYGLSQEGLEFATSRITPELRGTKQE